MLSKSLTVALGMGSVPSVTTPYTLAAVAGAGGSSRSIFASCIPSSVKLGLYCQLSMSCLMSAIISSDYISFILWSLGRKQPVLPFSFGPPMLCGTFDMCSDLWSMQTATILRTFFGCPGKFPYPGKIFFKSYCTEPVHKNKEPAFLLCGLP